MQTHQTTATDATVIAAAILAVTDHPSDAPCALCGALQAGPAGTLCRQCYSSYVSERQPHHTPAKARTRREPIFMTDTDGLEIALIPTNKKGMVIKIGAADLRDLTTRGFSDQVTLMRDAKSGYHYAFLNVTGLASATVMLSRLIVDAGRKKNVTYADGDRLNLRRDNLRIGRGCGKNVVQQVNRMKLAEARDFGSV